MNISFYLKLYALTIPIFFIIEILWLGVIAKGFYRRKLSFILSADVNWAAAVIFYLIYIAGILFFAVRPALTSNSWRDAVTLGSLFGFSIYHVFKSLLDFPNLKAISIADVLR